MILDFSYFSYFWKRYLIACTVLFAILFAVIISNFQSKYRKTNQCHKKLKKKLASFSYEDFGSVLRHRLASTFVREKPKKDDDDQELKSKKKIWSDDNRLDGRKRAKVVKIKRGKRTRNP